VRSIFPGRVAFAAEYPSLGLTVILDHGDGYYSVTGNLSRIEVQVGDKLGAGATLGNVGADPGQALLVLELRKGNELLDPTVWFGV
jgi:murein hydrolase activator